MTNIRKNKKFIIALLIMLGTFCLICKNVYNYNQNKQDNKKVDDYLKKDNLDKVANKDSVSKANLNSNAESYIAVLEIPKLSLKRGLYTIDSKNNNLKKTIQILDESDMPDVENGNLILAGHSGSGRIAYFKNLHKLNYGDEINVFFNNIKYKYKVVSIYLEKKDGSIDIKRHISKNTLTLTTCDYKDKNSQRVIISELVSKESY